MSILRVVLYWKLISNISRLCDIDALISCTIILGGSDHVTGEMGHRLLDWGIQKYVGVCQRI